MSPITTDSLDWNNQDPTLVYARLLTNDNWFSYLMHKYDNDLKKVYNKAFNLIPLNSQDVMSTVSADIELIDEIYFEGRNKGLFSLRATTRPCSLYYLDENCNWIQHSDKIYKILTNNLQNLLLNIQVLALQDQMKHSETIQKFDNIFSGHQQVLWGKKIATYGNNNYKNNFLKALAQHIENKTAQSQVDEQAVTVDKLYLPDNQKF